MGIPSGLVGAVLFIVLLWPGFAYYSIRAKNRPDRKLTSLQEIVTIVSASLIAIATTGLVFGIIRVAWPSVTPDVRRLLFEPQAYLKDHYVRTGWWAASLLAAAVLGSAAVALAQSYPRLSRVRWLNWLVAPPDSSTMSAWWIAFSDRDPRKEHIYVGCAIDDGSHISGRLHSFSQLAEDSPDRDLVLRAPISVRPAGASQMEGIKNAALMTISARHIVSVTVTYVRRPAPGTSPPTPPAPTAPGAALTAVTAKLRQR